MTKAVLKDGVFRPIGPVPADWVDGTEVGVVISLQSGEKSPTDEWMDAVEQAASECDPGDGRLLREEVDEIRREAKELARQGRL